MSLGRSCRCYSALGSERNTNHRTSFSVMYTYLFTLRFKPPINFIILDFCRHFKIYLGQVGPNVWRLVMCLHFRPISLMLFFSLVFLHLYSPRPSKASIVIAINRSTRALLSTKGDYDRGWYDRSVIASTVNSSLPRTDLFWRGETINVNI